MTSSVLLAQAADLLIWYNAVFLAVFGMGLLFTLLQVIGLGGEGHVDTDAHVDVDADVDADVDVHLDAHVDVDADADVDADIDAHLDHDVDTHMEHDADTEAGSPGLGFTSAFAQLLGLGKVPLSISLMMLCYTVGLAGWISNQVLAPKIGSPAAFFPISLLVALIVGFVLLRLLSRFMARYVPSFSTSAMGPRQLVGLSAQTVLPVNDRVGLATLHDKYGTLHTVRCCTANGPIEKGQQVVLVRYLPERNMYMVGKA